MYYHYIGLLNVAVPSHLKSLVYVAHHPQSVAEDEDYHNGDEENRHGQISSVTSHPRPNTIKDETKDKLRSPRPGPR